MLAAFFSAAAMMRRASSSVTVAPANVSQVVRIDDLPIQLHRRTARRGNRHPRSALMPIERGYCRRAAPLLEERALNRPLDAAPRRPVVEHGAPAVRRRD